MSDNYEYKKRVTKNDKKNKKGVYSQKHVRILLKQLDSKTINVGEDTQADRKGVCSSKVGGVVESKGSHAHRK
jgi:hypothetical protein